MRIHGVKEIEERRLFHGTENQNVDSICKFNFDLRLAGKHAHMYGKGEWNNTVIAIFAPNDCNVGFVCLPEFNLISFFFFQEYILRNTPRTQTITATAARICCLCMAEKREG